MFFDPEFLPSILIITSFLLVCTYVYRDKKIDYKILVIVGFLVRIFLMYCDYYDIFIVFGSGMDTERFHAASLYNMYATEEWKITNYTTFLKPIYILSNGSRLIAQYVNVLFGFFTIIITLHILQNFRLDKKTTLFTTILLTLLPNQCCFSAILLREAWIIFFVTLSLMMFVKWFLYGNQTAAIMSIVVVFVASYMHSGVILVLAGYIVAFITYSPRAKRVIFNAKGIILLVIMGIVIVAGSSYLGIFTEKFSKLEDVDDFIQITNMVSEGGSAYLQWIRTDSVFQSILFSPIKMIYFLFSPLPADWRGMTDIVAFMLDGIVYLILVYHIMRNMIKRRDNPLKTYIAISVIFTVFTFAYGTYNSGTAMRHRSKIFPIIVVLYAIVRKENTDNKQLRILSLNNNKYV